MKVIKIKNWEKHQHYKDRRPPWIKLHVELLDDYNYIRLHDDSKLLLIHLWLLASKVDNCIPYDLDYLTKKLPIKVKESSLKDLEEQGFILVASGSLSSCKQFDMPETEAEAETEAEQPEVFALSESPNTETTKYHKQAEEILQHFNTVCHKALTLTKVRKSIIISRLKEGKTVEQLKIAITNFSQDTWEDRHRYCDIVYAIGVRSKVDNFDKWFKEVPKNGVLDFINKRSR